MRLKGSVGDLRKFRKKEKRKREREETAEGQSDEESPLEKLEVVEGTGRIVAAGETIQGFQTKFRHEIETGDMLLVLHPATLLPEERFVSRVDTDRTLFIHPPFSKDFISTTPFKIKKSGAKFRKKGEKSKRIRKSDGVECEAEEPSRAESAASDDDIAAAREATKELNKKLRREGRIVSVREKKGMWGYRVSQVKLKGEATAEAKLDLRCKQGRDKYCW